MKKKYFHYTTEGRIDEIINSGEIKLATNSVFSKKEKAVAWVSTNLKWENTASKIISDRSGNLIHLTFEKQIEVLGCGRIEVQEIGLMSWAKLKHEANMDFKAAQGFEKTGLLQGANSNEWYGSLTPIRKSRWIKAEVFKDGEWKLYEDFQKENENFK